MNNKMNLNKASDPDLWISFLDLARQLIAKDVDFCLDLKIGNQSFSYDTKISRKLLDFSDPTGTTAGCVKVWSQV